MGGHRRAVSAFTRQNCQDASGSLGKPKISKNGCAKMLENGPINEPPVTVNKPIIEKKNMFANV